MEFIWPAQHTIGKQREQRQAGQQHQIGQPDGLHDEALFDSLLARTVIDYRAAQPVPDAPRQAVSHSRRIACCWASRLPVVHADRQGSAGVLPLAWLHAWDIRSRAEHSALAQGYSPVNRGRLVRKAVEHERSNRWRTKPILKSDWQATERFSSRSPGMAVARGACVTLPCASHICVLRIDGTGKTPLHPRLPDNSRVEPALRQRRVWARLSAGLSRKTVAGRCLFPRHTSLPGRYHSLSQHYPPGKV